MNEEDVIKSLKQLKHIRTSDDFRQTLKQTLAQKPPVRSAGMPSFKAIGLTLTFAVLFLILGMVYVNPAQTQTGSANLQQTEPVPTATATSQLQYVIKLDMPEVIPTPSFDPDNPLNDVWEKSLLSDETLAQEQPFPILYPTNLPEGAKLKATYLISTKFFGAGIELVYSIPNSISSLSLTQFVDDTTYSLSLNPDVTTLYTVGASDAACYPLDNKIKVFAWSKGNYILEMMGSLPCDTLHAIALSMQ